MKITELKINKANPRFIRDEKFKLLKKSVQEFPSMMELRPIVIDTDGTILGGNMRYRALLDLGYKELPDTWVKRADQLTDAEKQRFIIEDNVGFGEWDWDMLSSEWDEQSLKDWGMDLPTDWGGKLEATEDDYEIPDEIQTDIVPGDLFEIGEHRLLCGDSTDSDAVARLMGGEKADMVFTDPPYNADYSGRGQNNLGKIMNDNLSKKQFEDFIKGFISNILIGIKEGASIYICCDLKDSYPRFYFNLQDAGINISANIIWNKGSAGMGWQDYRYQYEFIIYGFKIGAKHNWYGGRTQTDVWDFSRDNTIDYNHPTQKPIKLSSQAINNSSKSEDLILDLFLGSGSTMVAAHQLSRKCYGMELDPKYCQVIIDRMRKLDPTLIIKKNGVQI